LLPAKVEDWILLHFAALLLCLGAARLEEVVNSAVVNGAVVDGAVVNSAVVKLAIAVLPS
jgi:hypothetical protein